MNKIKEWFKKFWPKFKNFACNTSVLITEEIQKGLKNGTIKSVAQVVEAIFPITGKIPEEVVIALEKVVPKVLAVQLVLKDLPENPTIQDLEKMTDSVLQAFGALDDKSKLWTTLAAEIYSSVQLHMSDKKYTFAECVIDVEKAWRAFQKIKNS